MPVRSFSESAQFQSSSINGEPTHVFAVKKRQLDNRPAHVDVYERNGRRPPRKWHGNITQKNALMPFQPSFYRPFWNQFPVPFSHNHHHRHHNHNHHHGHSRTSHAQTLHAHKRGVDVHSGFENHPLAMFDVKAPAERKRKKWRRHNPTRRRRRSRSLKH